MDNSLRNATPEQKLAILRNEILTPLAIIQGCAAMLRKHIETGKQEPPGINDCSDGISKASDKIKRLLDEIAL